MVVEKNVKVSKEADELAKAIVDLVKSSKEALADGFQVGTDLPAVIVGNMGSLMSGIQGVDKLGEEFKEDKSAFIMAWVAMGTEIAGLFIDKE